MNWLCALSCAAVGYAAARLIDALRRYDLHRKDRA